MALVCVCVFSKKQMQLSPPIQSVRSKQQSCILGTVGLRRRLNNFHLEKANTHTHTHTPLSDPLKNSHYHSFLSSLSVISSA